MATNDVLIVGTVALDSVKTPFGHVQNALGGSASYASTACSFFSPARIISIVGEDFPPEHLAFLQSRGIDTSGIKKEGKTFHWEGFHEFDMNEAKTIRTELNSLATFAIGMPPRSEEHTSELQSQSNLVFRPLLVKKKPPKGTPSRRADSRLPTLTLQL